MKVYKIHNNLWRVSNNNKVKDVFVLMGKIVEAENPYNTLTEEERIEVEKAINK